MMDTEKNNETVQGKVRSMVASVLEPLRSPAFCLMVGLLLGCIVTYFAMRTRNVALEKELDAEKAYLAASNERVQRLGAMSEAELKAWVAKSHSYYQDYIMLQDRLNRQELALAYSHDNIIFLSLAFVAVAAFAVVYWLRRSDRDAASAIQMALALAPPEMYKALHVASYAQVETIVVEDAQTKGVQKNKLEVDKVIELPLEE